MINECRAGDNNMNIYILVDGSDHDDYADEFISAVELWIKNGQGNVCLLNHKQPLASDAKTYSLPPWELGITFSTNKKAKLKGPLTFLYGLAETLELDYVVGTQLEEGGSRQDICYFGFDEGRPELSEMASYLGFNR